MKNFMQIAQGMDVRQLLLDLKRQPFLWNKNPCRLSKRGPHYETSDIFLRSKDETENIANKEWASFSQPHVPEWYKSIENLPSAKPLIFDLMRAVQGEILGSVLLYKVEPGQRIHSHVDTGWNAEVTEKFNICLQSNDKAAFCYDNEKMYQKAGDVHWFCNTVNHWVVNEGENDHIILTVCIKMDSGYRVPWSPEGWTMDKCLDGRI
jgi:hypothetical protein